MSGQAVDGMEEAQVAQLRALFEMEQSDLQQSMTEEQKQEKMQSVLAQTKIHIFKKNPEDDHSAADRSASLKSGKSFGHT